jgi:hypothetical protein
MHCTTEPTHLSLSYQTKQCQFGAEVQHFRDLCFHHHRSPKMEGEISETLDICSEFMLMFSCEYVLRLYCIADCNLCHIATGYCSEGITTDIHML